MKFDTDVIHAGYDPEEHNRALMPPIYQNSMFLMKEIGEQIPFRYSRLGNPTRRVLEDTMAELEHGVQGFAFGSGITAIDAVWRAFLQPNDTIVATSDIYGGSYDLLTQVYAKWGVNVIFVDLTQPANLEAILTEHKVKMVWLESPSNPLLRLVDIKALCQIARSHDVEIIGMDNTFATPYLQNPLDLGVDIVVHSATKYLCGHSDVLLGLAVAKHHEHAKALQNIQINTGGVAGPVDCSLVIRGIKTLSVRMKQHIENANIIAQRLQSHPAIERVFYPALSSHEHHNLAQNQMRGAGGVVSVYLKKDTRQSANTVIRNLKLVCMSSSLGGVESLVNHSASQSHSGMTLKVRQELGIREGLLRFSIGIEDVEDIWQDINQALNSII